MRANRWVRVPLSSRSRAALTAAAAGFAAYGLSGRSARCAAGEEHADTRPKALTLPIVSRTPASAELLFNPGVVAVTIGAAVVIPTILFLAFRSANRAEKIEDFVRALELHVNRNPLVKQHLGPIYAAGKYQLAIEKTTGSGYVFFSGGGNVRGVVTVEASRPSKAAPWEYSALKIEMDKAALDERSAQRRAAAIAKYGAAAVAAADAAAAAAGVRVVGLSAPLAAGAEASTAAGAAGASADASSAAGVNTVAATAANDADEGEVLTITLA